MYNRVILMGRLTADPELRQTQSGIAMCRFSIAVDRGYAKQGEEKQTDFFNIVCWRQQAEFVSRYFSKGRMIHVEGRLQQNNYTDQNGVKHYSVDVQADNVAFCGDKPQNANTGAQQGAGGGYAGSMVSYPTRSAILNEDVAMANKAIAEMRTRNAMQQTPSAFAGASMEDFEDVLSDGETPF